jgi:Arm domain-containing DNA-binding protein
MASRGSVYKRGTTWTAHVKWQQAGEYQQRKEGGYRTKKLAEQALTRLLASVDEGTYMAPSRLTVGAYLDRWLDGLPTTGLRASTITATAVVCAATWTTTSARSS